MICSTMEQSESVHDNLMSLRNKNDTIKISIVNIFYEETTWELFIVTVIIILKNLNLKSDVINMIYVMHILCL